MMRIADERLPRQRVLMDLDGTWSLKRLDPESSCLSVFDGDFIPEGWLDAPVPGDVHDALSGAGLIDGFYLGKKLDDQRWIDECDWLYCRRFRAPKDARNVYLRFEGIDTLADVYLNGTLIGSTDDMFVPWEGGVDGLLRPDGENVLAVRVRSTTHAMKDVDRTGLYPQDDTERLLLRKSQMNYGWDFCGHCKTAGLWKGVKLISKEKAALQDVYLRAVSIDDGKARLRLSARIDGSEAFEGGTVRLRLFEDGRCVLTEEWPASEAMEKQAVLPSPRLWWPHGYGEAFLYDARLELLGGGQVVDECRLRLGVRTVALDQSPLPEGGRRFAFRVNGRRLFVRGANWVPTHAVYADATDENTVFYLSRVLDAHITMLRIWGGGIYESDAFYDYCDEHGILIMQDFMMACGILPQGDKYLEQVSAEADYIVRHMRGRTCIAVWSGDNEVDDAYSWYGFKNCEYRTNRLNRVGVTEAVKRFDPDRPFMVSSPHSPFEDEEGGNNPNSPLQGDMHVYLTRFFAESRGYYKKLLSFVPRYVSEYGFSSLPCRDSYDRYNFFRRALDLKLDPWLGELKAFMDLGEEADPQRLIDYTQYSHARGLKYWIEYLRSHKGLCGGSMYWKFNDPWAPNRENMLFPSLMSVIDFRGYPKVPFYVARRAYQDVILAFRETADGALSVYSSNETEEADAGVLTIDVVGYNGDTRRLCERECVIAPDASVELWSIDPPDELKNMRDGYLRASFTGKNRLVNRFFFGDIADYIGAVPPAADLTVRKLSEDDRSMSLEITSTRYAQDVTLTVLDRECLFSDNGFEMDPGETRTVTVCLPRSRRAGKPVRVRAINTAAVCVGWENA